MRILNVSNVLRAGLLAATVIALPAYAVAPDPDTLTDIDVRVIDRDGKNYGCELGMDVQRKGGKDAISFSITTLRVTDERTARGTKLGYIAAPGANAAAPTSFFLVNDGGDNKGEISGSQLSDTAGFRLTAFKPGPQTIAAYGNLSSGKLMISVTLDDGKSRVWAIDFSKRKDIRDQWASCNQNAVPLED